MKSLNCDDERSEILCISSLDDVGWHRATTKKLPTFMRMDSDFVNESIMPKFPHVCAPPQHRKVLGAVERGFWQ